MAKVTQVVDRRLVEASHLADGCRRELRLEAIVDHRAGGDALEEGTIVWHGASMEVRLAAAGRSIS